MKLCPICRGKGIVPASFYETELGQSANVDNLKMICRACAGTGIVSEK